MPSRECPDCGRKMHHAETPEHPSNLHAEDCPGHEANVRKTPAWRLKHAQSSLKQALKDIDKLGFAPRMQLGDCIATVESDGVFFDDISGEV